MGRATDAAEQVDRARAGRRAVVKVSGTVSIPARLERVDHDEGPADHPVDGIVPWWESV